jgi:TRAP-type mannitol/chloroaromatic compound transport system permease large subunit
VQNLGIDLILFGVLSTIAVEMAQITPPIGINVFILNGMSPDVAMYDIFKGIIPFLICMMLCVALIMVFPDIALFLPRTMGR